MLFALALGTACGDDTTLDPTGGEQSSTGEGTTTSAMTSPTSPTSPTSLTDPTTGGSSTTDATDTGGSTSPGDTTAGGACGNGTVEGDEACDGDDLDGSDCQMQGFFGGELGCNDDCTYDTTMCVMAGCGDAMAGDDEDCDGDDLGGQDCMSLDMGFDDGTLGCNDDCTFDTSMCVMFSCGNDMMEGKDVCDGTDLAGEDCASQGFDGGMLGCNDDCLGFDTSGCYECGNDVVEGPEQCDGTDLDMNDCTTQGFMFGDLACDEMCMFDTSGCTDDPIFCSTPGSIIDGSAVAVDTIVVPALGQFVSDVDVSVDITHAYVGDMEIDVRHVDTDTSRRMFDNSCTSNDDIVATFDQEGVALVCASPIVGDILPVDSLDGFTGLPDPAGTWEISINDTFPTLDDGVLNEWCVSFELAAMDPSVCGDGTTTFGEVCDGMNLSGETCASQGFVDGTLACAADCATFDTSGCNSCGNGVADPGEQCDGADLDMNDCTTQGFVGGVLACDAACMFDTSSCTNDPTFCSSPGSIIDGSAVVVDTVMVPSVPGEYVTDVNVTVEAPHAFVGDVEIDIRHVTSDTSRRMVDNICGGADDINAVFDQDAAAAPDCVAPVAIEGPVLPLESLDSFTGILDPGGAWEISVNDTFSAADDGVLDNWCVTIQTSPVDPNVCGDGINTFVEACDGADLGGETCVSQGFDDGILACAADCASFDTSGCTTCGDGLAQPPEECDGADFGGLTCGELGYAGGGALACDASCGIDESGCVGPLCGDDSVDAPETCDNQEIAGTQCEDLGFAGGSLGCSFPGCDFDTSECSDTVVAVCASPALPIDSAIPTTTSTVSVPAGLNVVDVDVFVGITHTFNADLDVFLIHETTGTTVELTTDQCVGDDDVFAFFNDEADALPNCVEPVGIEGNVQPEGILADFNGEAIAGDWTLEITDDAAGDFGTLDEWCIYIQAG